MDPIAPLEVAQLAGFVLLGLAALRVWARQRTRPASYLAAAFGVLALVLVLARLRPQLPDGRLEVVRDLGVIGLGVFPWLLAAFAWSFERRLPRWLTVAGAAVAALALWVLLLPPLPGAGEARGGAQTAFVAMFLLTWVGLAVAAAQRLWRAGGGQRIIRSRMRLMAVGAVTLALALLLAAFGPAGVRPATMVLSLASAALFVTGFSPPAPLRFWWRRRSTAQWQRMQTDLIAAVTPSEAAGAVTSVAADVTGGGVAVVAADGTVLAQRGMAPAEASLLAQRLTNGQSLTDEEDAVRIDDAWMVVRRTPYTPLFGFDEQQIIEAMALHLRLALERTEYLTAHQKALAEAENAKSELEAMLVGLSHDLRSPAVAIVGFARLLRGASDSGERDQMLDDIETSARYLGRLVDAMLELSRVGHTQLDVEPVNLDTTVRAAASRIAATAPEMTVAVRPGLPVVFMNHSRAEQVFDNLLGNAVKHGGRDDVTVTIEAQDLGDDGVRLLITDDGQGIHHDERDTVFTLFKRARGAATDGNGVGLGLVRRIVELYGGTIEVTDHSGGAQFRIDLPADVLAPGPPGTGGRTTPPPSRSVTSDRL